jgi:acetolactate decarboxylase
LKTIRCNIPNSLYLALHQATSMDQTRCDSLITDALSRYLGMPIHTLFQVSTSAALVEGLYQGAVQVSRLLRHGDFGLGTFVDLTGEMVVLDGVCYQICPDGAVRDVEGDRWIPYALVTRFTSETGLGYQEIASFDDLLATCDGFRKSDNLFYAFRLDGSFPSLKTRVMMAVQEGTSLKAAASEQKEFHFEATEGTLVGFWSPAYAKSFSVPGYHFHFLSKNRQQGGHVLACHARNITINSCTMNEMHVCLPETEEFLRADLSRDPNDDLMSAEQNHTS